MRLPPEEAKRFIDLHVGLIGWCVRRLDPKSAIHDAATLRALPLEGIADARDRVLDQPAVLDAYVAENPDRLSPAELELVSGWRRFVRRDFVVERDLKRHTIFIDLKNPPTAYGVLALNDEIVEILPMPLPMLVEAVLLPWRGAIVCDGIIRFKHVHLGPGIRRRLKDAYREAKARGIVTSLPETSVPTSTSKKQATSRRTASARGKPRDPKRAFLGRWRIVQMEAWDEDYFEMDGPAFIEVEQRGHGSFKFGLVEGEIDCRFHTEGGNLVMEFSWAGWDENDLASGRGRACIDGSQEMRGRIFIHLGDDSEFVAKRVK